MKWTLLICTMLITTAAFGQYYGGGHSVEPQIYLPPDHPAHASYSAMLQEHSIVGGTGYAMGQGDRPFWDFPQQEKASLGDVARELRKEHESAKKAVRVWEKQQ